MSLSRFHDWLCALCSLPTAAGCEQHVIAWVERWVKDRPGLSLRRDEFGNLLIAARDHDEMREKDQDARPVVFAAHLDHPAFVVSEVLNEREVMAAFRGGVRDAFFQGTSVHLHASASSSPVVGCVTKLIPPANETEFKHGVIQFDQAVAAQPGDLVTWALPKATIEGDRFSSPACDDLAGVAAALAAVDQLLARNDESVLPDLQLLLTRSEEIGFIGAIAACQSGLLSPDARIVALENSKSMADSPIGDGPIVRVGDRLSTFDPALTHAMAHIAQGIAEEDSSFKWQRKLMAGGACEATAYQAFGFQATCLCLPLGNYHNMDETAGKIASEYISISDFDGLVRLLVAVGEALDSSVEIDAQSQALRDRLAGLLERHRGLLEADEFAVDG